mmetsp:Transcript_30391/g.43093  ORF Transcript_30391/g.43093 Transcript_30391/m.43093 type:complete len:92 (+) Transcript_30391:25-300(+)
MCSFSSTLMDSNLCSNLLYTLHNGAYNTSQNTWAFLNTVEACKAIYTKQEYEATTRARQVQNIIMHPSLQSYLDIANKNLLYHNPVQPADI